MTFALLALVFAAPPVDFDTQVVPVFTKSGCNAGACHGAASGRGGLHLSLFGADPARDYNSLVHQLEGRRVDLANPQQSLVLRKPTAQLKHGGGFRLEDDGAKIIADWIAAGARRADRAKQLTQFQILPPEFIIAKQGDSITLRAVARFDNGPETDVTTWTVLAPADPAAIAVDDATAVVQRPGQHVVIARFLNRVVPVRLTLPFGDNPIDHSREPRANFIDDDVLAALTALRLPVSPLADDATYLRRLRLDLTGRLPKPDEIDQFTADSGADNRDRLVDRLLSSDDFIEYWAFRLALLLRNRTLPNETRGTEALHAWLRDQLKRGVGFDRTVRELVAAKGDSHVHGPAWFARLANDPGAQAELIGRAFLGVRLQCANCHNHPLDRWTQDDYHGLAAMFAKLERGRIVRMGSRGNVTHPRTGEFAVPMFPGVELPADCADPREPLADWLTKRDNPLFAKAIVNRLWQAMFGRGLIEPVDDVRDTNPATHPALLNRLADDFVAHNFDLGHTLRMIALSNTYGRGANVLPTNRDDHRFYSRSYSRPLPAEVLADAIADVTGVPEIYAGLPARAVALVDPATPSRALDLLGRCPRTDSCDSSGPTVGLSATLHRLNGELVNRKLTDIHGRLQIMIAAGKTNDEIMAMFTQLAFGRVPNAAEKQLWTIHANVDRTAWLEDATWAILNSREFMTNH